ncbi:MAG: aldo/keto reductase [Solobacterium sp.]|jgi:predicted oxidoreductase|nr:aldo/keto reductase [Solobacterium sp.]MCH4223129.1 aldo/keto reductase [Solobacterium sp.]MCH4266528.1 aldo/keto reductase [Solobacterium sp.]
MKQVRLGSSGIEVPSVAVGCMHLCELSQDAAEQYVLECIDQGATFFDHADIYGKGQCETIFGNILKKHPEVREKIFLQSKCGIISGKMYDLSKDYILKSVDGILSRLQTDHLDALLLHRPDALVEPEEVAEAFDSLKQSGKVKNFGVSNMNSMQMELLRKYLHQPLIADQLQFSIPVANMVSQGMEVNMDSQGSFDHDGSVLDYCRLNDIAVQAWSPFQKANWQGPFIGAEDCAELNQALNEVGEAHHASPTTIAAAWILRHPAKMQVIAGTTKISRMKEIIQASEIELTREEWYRLYLAVPGHILP